MEKRWGGIFVHFLPLYMLATRHIGGQPSVGVDGHAEQAGVGLQGGNREG